MSTLKLTSNDIAYYDIEINGKTYHNIRNVDLQVNAIPDSYTRDGSIDISFVCYPGMLNPDDFKGKRLDIKLYRISRNYKNIDIQYNLYNCILVQYSQRNDSEYYCVFVAQSMEYVNIEPINTVKIEPMQEITNALQEQITKEINNAIVKDITNNCDKNWVTQQSEINMMI